MLEGLAIFLCRVCQWEEKSVSGSFGVAVFTGALRITQGKVSQVVKLGAREPKKDVCVCVCVCVCVFSTQSCPTLCDPMDCNPPGSSVHGILQERILERIAIPFSRGSSQPRDQTCIAREFFTS